jgi:hypothetical protein
MIGPQKWSNKWEKNNNCRSAPNYNSGYIIVTYYDFAFVHMLYFMTLFVPYRKESLSTRFYGWVAHY